MASLIQSQVPWTTGSNVLYNFVQCRNVIKFGLTIQVLGLGYIWLLWVILSLDSGLGCGSDATASWLHQSSWDSTKWSSPAIAPLAHHGCSLSVALSVWIQRHMAVGSPAADRYRSYRGHDIVAAERSTRLIALQGPLRVRLKTCSMIAI